MKANIRQIWENNPNEVFFLKIPHLKQDVAFVTIPPRASNMQCDACKSSVWNASNLNNDVHFCVNRDLDIEFSRYYRQVKVEIKK